MNVRYNVWRVKYKVKKNTSKGSSGIAVSVAGGVADDDPVAVGMS